ncbi:MAG TPA: hypothetical protein VFQ53_30555 [Kofleriaceae bacterium]|nr:hypothetical protein [Kofleriaceae bacterium]
MRLACVALALLGCGARTVEPLANSSHARSLLPADHTDCTATGWCRFTNQPPIDIANLYVTDRAVFAVGSLGTVDVEPATAAVARWDGEDWKIWRLEGSVLLSIDGRGNHDLWATGRKTRVYHLTGEDWEAVGELQIYDPAKLAVSAGDVFVAFGGGILRRDGDQWRPVLMPAASGEQTIYDLSADDQGGAYAIVKPDSDEARPYRWNAQRATFEPFDGARDIYRISARGPRDVAIVGNAGLRRWDGARWTDVPYQVPIGQSAIVHRGSELVVLGGLDDKRSGVAFVGAAGTVVDELPDDCEALAAGPDRSLWVASCKTNHLWFRAR